MSAKLDQTLVNIVIKIGLAKDDASARKVLVVLSIVIILIAISISQGDSLWSTLTQKKIQEEKSKTLKVRHSDDPATFFNTEHQLHTDQ